MGFRSTVSGGERFGLQSEWLLQAIATAIQVVDERTWGFAPNST